MLNILSSEFSADEVKTTLFQMGPTKASRTDGMNALFYQKFWPVWLISLSNVVLMLLIYVWIKKCVEMCKRLFKM